MEISNKKCFMIGYLTGQALRRGVNGTSGVSGENGTGLASGYDALSFRAGLAAGLCGAGCMIPYEPSSEKPGTFDIDTNCDEILIDLYSRYAHGNAVAPRLYGMQDLADWLKGHDIQTLDDFYAACEALAKQFGGTYTQENALKTTALFFCRSYYQETYKKQGLPAVYGINSVSTGGEYTWEEFFKDRGVTVDVTRDGWTYTIIYHAEKDFGSNSAGLCPEYNFKSNVLCPGKYRLSFSEIVTPPFAYDYEDSRAWVVLWLCGALENQQNIKTNHYYPTSYYLAPGESVEFEILGDSIEYSYLLAKVIPFPPAIVDGNNMQPAGRSFKAGTSYTQTISLDLQLIEAYPMQTPNESVKLTDLLRAIDSLGDYKIYNASLDRLEPLALINEYSLLVSGSPHKSGMYPAVSADTTSYTGSLVSATIESTASLDDNILIDADVDGKEMTVRTVRLYFPIGKANTMTYYKYEGTGMKDGTFGMWSTAMKKRRPPE